MIRCKMQLESVIPFIYGGVQANFRCQYDEKLIKEDLEFSKATPTGMAEFRVENPKAIEQLVIGEFYYVDFNKIPREENNG